jgi:DNA polymerase-3 subunit beta
VEATFEISNTRAALAWLSPAITDDAQHQGIHFIGDGQTLRIEAVDGRQLHHVAIESSAVVNAIVPANLIRLVKAFEADGGCMVEITERTISFRTEKILICLQLLQGEFPDTSRVIPSPSDKLLILPKADLENALKAAGAVIEKNFGSGAVNVSVKPASTTIRTDRCGPGLVEMVIEVPNPFEVDFQIDPARLLNALKHVDTDDVVIQCDDPLRSVCIRHGDFLAVIALMRAP